MDLAALLKLADFGLYALERGLVAQEKIDEIRERRERMAAEGRDPTPEEWADIANRLEALTAGSDLDDVADRARASGA